MICGAVLTTQNGEVVALCKEAEHEGEWHEANEVRLDYGKAVVDIRWRNIKEEETEEQHPRDPNLEAFGCCDSGRDSWPKPCPWHGSQA